MDWIGELYRIIKAISYGGTSRKLPTQFIAALDQTVTPTGGGSPQSATATLNNTQIKALPTTPVEILPAPGLGKAYQLFSGTLILNNTAGVYIADVNSSVQLQRGRYASSVCQWGTALTIASKWYYALYPYGSIGTGDFTGSLMSDSVESSEVDNQPLVVADTFDGVSDYTEGNASNTLKVTVYYTVVDVS